MKMIIATQIFVAVLLALFSGAQSAKKPRGELKIDVIEKPDSCSVVSAKGDRVGIHYAGSLTTGEVFDSSKGRSPLSFKLGDGKTIPGFDQGIVGMCLGEKRVLTIPPHLGYGEKGHPPAIPPRATLKFEIELVELEKISIFSSGAFGTTFNTAVPLFIFGMVIYYLYSKAQSEVFAKKRPKLKAERRRQG